MPIERRRDHVVAGLICLPFIFMGWFDSIWTLVYPSRTALSWWLSSFFRYIFIPLGLLWILHRTTRVYPRHYGLSAEYGVADVVVLSALPAITIFFIDILVQFVSTEWIGYTSAYTASHVKWEKVLKPLGGLWVVATIYLSAAAGLWESLFFIGLPWLWLSRGQKTTYVQQYAFAILSGVAFALGHLMYGVPRATGAFAFQILAVLWYLRMQTLWPVIIGHFLIDVVWFWPK